MAGLIARLFGGQPRPPDPDPLPGQGGYQMPAGPAGQSGFPGSTSAVRTFKGATPRAVKLDKDALGGIDNTMGTTLEVRQQSYRGDAQGDAVRNPRATPAVVLPQTQVRQDLQNNSAAEFYGGQPLKTRPGFDLAGQNPLTGAQAAGGHSVRDTETPMTQRQPVIGVGTPGAQNVRNTRAQRYKAVPGQVRSYESSPRGDEPCGQVTVESRFIFPGGGNQTWSSERRMPYGGRGDGARGAQLNGTRYYGTGQENQFFNAGQGQYGIARQQGSGNKSPVGFTEPAPWTANYYTTTADVGTADAPGPGAQSPSLVYTAPQSPRASNTPGYRRGQ